MRPYRDEAAGPVGRRWRLNAAGQAVVAANIALAHFLAARFGEQVPHLPFDDLFAEAQDGLVYAATLWDDSRGVPFGTYAAAVIMHRLIRTGIVGPARRKARYEPLGDPNYVPDARPKPDPDAVIDAREELAEVRRTMPEQLFNLVWLHYGLEVDGATIGRKIGRSRERVRQLILEAERWAWRERAKRKQRDSVPPRRSQGPDERDDPADPGPAEEHGQGGDRRHTRVSAGKRNQDRQEREEERDQDQDDDQAEGDPAVRRVGQE